MAQLRSGMQFKANPFVHIYSILDVLPAFDTEITRLDFLP